MYICEDYKRKRKLHSNRNMKYVSKQTYKVKARLMANMDNYNCCGPSIQFSSWRYIRYYN